MTKLNRLAAMFLLSLSAAVARAQEVNGEERSFMESEGKIYVVMAVVVTIVAGLLIYLVRLDRKIAKMEKRN